MARCWKPRYALFHLAALVAVGCTYDWLGVEPSSASAGTGGIDPAGGAAGNTDASGGAEAGGASVAGAGGGSAAGGTPSSGSQGGASSGATGGGGAAPGGAGGAPGGGGGAGGAAGGGTGGDEVCPGNEVNNPGFENGLDGWIKLDEEGGSRGGFEVTADLAPSGAGALSIDTTSVSPPTAADYRLVIASSVIPVDPGDTLSLSVRAGAVPGDYGLPAAGLRFFDLTNAMISESLAEITSASVAPFEMQVTVPGASTSARVIFEVRNGILLLADDVCLLRDP